MNIDKFIQEALKEAEKSKMRDWKMGAVIVRGGKIVGRGHNKFSGEFKRIEKKYGVTLFSLHAEMEAVISCDGSLDGASMFVAGVKPNGNKIYSRPCKNCLKIIRQLPFRTVYYQTKVGVESIHFRR
jgi:deoxycytidylate deaminase